jgi:hypothetical protein
MVEKMLKYAKKIIYRHLQFQLYGKTKKKKKTILSAPENNLTADKKMRKCDLGNVDQALLEWYRQKNLQNN